jgi:hypothetical protein
MKALLFLTSICCLLSVKVFAYPPAPHHILEGLVRNEQGVPILGDNIMVIAVSTEGGSIVSKVNEVFRPGVNYSLNVPMESGVGRNLFDTAAFKHKVEFSLKVIIDGKDYLPIEMIGNTSKMGMPGETTYLDLTIGEDRDGDGLPDAWERGIASFTGQSLDQIGPNDDSDGDGLSNLQEYISGSYAFDKNDGVVIHMKEVSVEKAKFEFLVIPGRTYSIEMSTDFREWNQTDFKVTRGNIEENLSHFIAGKVENLSVYVPLSGGDTDKKLFFKLKVQ